jgi:enediyne biosynthesis protein E3
MLHVGAGWALARLPGCAGASIPLFPSSIPLARWLALDGYGFHQGYFYWPESVRRQAVPRGVNGYARRAFDQGLGRSLWFVEGAETAQIASAISAFPQARRADLWSGVGLACAYAGGRDRHRSNCCARPRDRMLPKPRKAPPSPPRRASGPATRLRIPNLPARSLCGRSAEAAASVTDDALLDLPRDGVEPAYEIWRRRIQERFTNN